MCFAIDTMSNVEICQVAYEGRMTRLKMMLEANPKLISVADQVPCHRVPCFDACSTCISLWNVRGTPATHVCERPVVFVLVF